MGATPTLQVHAQNKFSEERSREVVVFAKNARLHSADKISELLGELVQINAWDVLLFSETRRSSEAVDLEGGHRLFSSQRPTACAGVAILVHSKHVAAVQRVQTVDERVLYVDLRINGLTFRMVSVYMPHAGYPTEDLMQTYDSLHCVLEGARKRNIAYVVGGDFNTQLHVGPRGDLLMQTAHMFSMAIANAKQEHDSWTFCSSMGVRRRLDFVLCSTGFDVTHGGATDLLDLGSDHRAVRAALEVTGPRSLQGRKPVARKQRWSPSVAEKRRYQINLDTCLQQSALVNMYELESCVARCAKLASRQTAQRDLADVKPWQRQDFQDLLAQRRQCRDREGRARLSKQIRAHLRRHMRDRRNRRVNDILSEFRCLNRIEDVYHNPCKAVKNTREGPSPHEFTKYLEDIFTPDRMEMQDPHVGSHDVVPPFHLHELKQAIKNLGCWNCSAIDKHSFC